MVPPKALRPSEIAKLIMKVTSQIKRPISIPIIARSTRKPGSQRAMQIPAKAESA